MTCILSLRAFRWLDFPIRYFFVPLPVGECQAYGRECAVTTSEYVVWQLRQDNAARDFSFPACRMLAHGIRYGSIH